MMLTGSEDKNMQELKREFMKMELIMYWQMTTIFQK